MTDVLVKLCDDNGFLKDWQAWTPDLAEQIAKVEGIDGIFIGPSDLSGSIGKIGQFEDQEVQDLIYEGLELSTKAGKPAGILTGKKDYAKKYVEAGYTFVAINSDTNLFARSAENLLKEFK